MGLRNRTQQPFWRTPPIRTSDPSALHQHGIACVSRRDGKGMVAVGWAICQVAALHQYQASDFLTDGYRVWRESPGFDRGQGLAFLTDLFGALCSLTPPDVPADIWSASPEAVMPASIYFGTRCWAGNELLELATDPAIHARYEPLVYRSAAEAPHDFVPTRSIDFAKGYARTHGLEEPWVVVLPPPREHALAGAGPELTGSAAPPAYNGWAPPAAPPNGSAVAPTGGQNGDRPRPTPGPEAAPPPSAPEASATVVSPILRPEPPTEKAPTPEPPRVAELRRHILEWLRGSYRDVRAEDNGWITIPDIGPGAIQIETSLVEGDHLKVEVFAPLVLDVPLSDDLLRHVALEGGRFHFGAISLDADDGDEAALLQFSHSLLADHLDRDSLLAVVHLVASTVVERSTELQRRFGGMLYRELAAS